MAHVTRDWHHFEHLGLLTLEETGLLGCRCSVIVSHCSGRKPHHSTKWHSILFIWQYSFEYWCTKKCFASARFNHFGSWAHPRNIMFAFVFLNTFKLGFKRAEWAVSVKSWHRVLVNSFVLLDVFHFEVGSFQSEHWCLSEVCFYCSTVGSADIDRRWRWQRI